MADKILQLSPIQRKIAQKMSLSKAEIPHVTTIREVNLGKVMARRAELQNQSGVKMSFMPFIISCATAAIAEFPLINSTFNSETNEITLKEDVNIGFAVSVGEQLLVPVLKGAQNLSFADIADGYAEIVQKCQTKTIKGSEMIGSTFTISNSGAFGGEIFTPIINYPESALLGMGRIKQKPVVSQTGAIEAAPMMYLCLSYDHRIINGATAVKYLGAVERLLEETGRYAL